MISHFQSDISRTYYSFEFSTLATKDLASYQHGGRCLTEFLWSFSSIIACPCFFATQFSRIEYEIVERGAVLLHLASNDNLLKLLEIQRHQLYTSAQGQNHHHLISCQVISFPLYFHHELYLLLNHICILLLLHYYCLSFLYTRMQKLKYLY